jgi:hypothetical protein
MALDVDAAALSFIGLAEAKPQPQGSEMRFLIALIVVMLSLPAARAQAAERQRSLEEFTAENIAYCRAQAPRFIECDNIRGCFDPTPEQLERAVQECRSRGVVHMLIQNGKPKK